MAEYIDREALKEKVFNRVLNVLIRSWLCGIIDEVPAADVVPVVHRRWTETDWVEMESGGHELIKTPKAALRCSNCRNCFKKELLWRDAFCPNCGAKMDKKEATHD